MTSLNIDHHIKHTILKALNISRTNKEAASILGISDRGLYFKMIRYSIIYDREAREYVEKPIKTKQFCQRTIVSEKRIIGSR